LNSVFAKHANNVVELFHRLDDGKAYGFLDKFPPEPGVYLFLEDGAPERIGRTNNLLQRLRTIYGRIMVPPRMRSNALVKARAKAHISQRLRQERPSERSGFR